MFYLFHINSIQIFPGRQTGSILDWWINYWQNEYWLWNILATTSFHLFQFSQSILNVTIFSSLLLLILAEIENCIEEFGWLSAVELRCLKMLSSVLEMNYHISGVLVLQPHTVTVYKGLTKTRRSFCSSEFCPAMK